MMIEKKALLSMMKFSEPMARHTTFRIGGPADIWAEPADLICLKEIMDLCKEEGLPVFIVGNGSNLLVKDSGVKGCVLNLNADAFKGIGIAGSLAKAGAGLKLAMFLNALCKEGLSGLEFLAGIPATVGGALTMNAGGVYGRVKKQIGEFAEEVTVMDKNGQVFNLGKDEIIFRYRGSNLEKYIVLGAKFKLKKIGKKEVSGRLKGYLAEKIARQELNSPSAGCIFKNPPADSSGRPAYAASLDKLGLASAGRLIDLSGLKGKRVGDAMVSTKHANFIINAGRASCSDVLALIDIIKKKVKKDHGVLLETEIRILG